MRAAKLIAVALSSIAAAPGLVGAKMPDCSGINRWPTRMAFEMLKGEYALDGKLKPETRRLASEKIGKDLYRQLHLVRFTDKSGAIIEVITSNEASSEECSMSGVQLYVISRSVDGR